MKKIRNLLFTLIFQIGISQTYQFDTIFSPHDGFQNIVNAYPERSLFIGNMKWLIVGKFLTVSGLKEIMPSYTGISAYLGIIYNDNTGKFEIAPNFITNGIINNLYKQNDSIIVTGNFDAVGITPSIVAEGIAVYRLSNNTWYPYGSGSVSGLKPVFCYAVHNGTPFIGGGFSNVNSQSFNNMAKFNSTTNAWVPVVVGTFTGVSSQINDLISDGNNIYIGGFFTTAGGVPANRVAMYNPTTNTFQALQGPGGNGVSLGGNNVTKLFYHNNNLYVGGNFLQCGGTVTAHSMARFNLNTNTWHAIGTTTAQGLSGTVNSLERVGDTLYVGGTISAFNLNGTVGISCQNIVALRLSTNTFTQAGIGAHTPSASSHVSTMSYGYNNRMFIGGSFNTVNNSLRKYNGGIIWRRNPNKVFQLSFGKGVIGGVNTIHKHNNFLYLGNLITADTMYISNICRFDPATNTYSNLGLGIGYDQFSGSKVGRIISRNDTLFVVGRFLTAGGQTVNSVAGYKTTTGTWFGMGTGIGPSNHQVHGIELYGNKVIVCGGFGTAGGNNIRNIAMYDLSTNTWTSVGSPTAFPVNSEIHDVKIFGNYLIAVGNFSAVNSIVCNGIAKYDLTTQTWTNVGFGFLDNSNQFSSGIRGIRLKEEGNELYVCGSFVKFNGILCNAIAKFDPVTNSVTAISNPTYTGIGNFFSGYVNDVVRDGNRLYIGGIFSCGVPTQPSYTTFSTSNIIGFNLQNNQFFPLSNANISGFNGEVKSVLIYNPNQLYFVGTFQYFRNTAVTGTISVIASNYIARANFGSPTDIDQDSKIPIHQSSVSVYPNPSQSHIFIDLQNSNDEVINVEIYDINGKLVMSSTYDEVNIQNLNNGIYMMKIHTRLNHIYSSKIIKN
jgi:hypothetical protein